MFLFRVEHVGGGVGGYEPKKAIKEYSSNRSRRKLKDAWLHVRGGRVEILTPGHSYNFAFSISFEFSSRVGQNKS